MTEPRQSDSLPTAQSECCSADMHASRGDGVWIGSCSACGESVIRLNPRTGVEEWLDGASPWTERDDLRRVNPVTLGEK